MKRALALLVGGVLVLGSVLTANAQAPTVSFGGQMRIYGFAYDNLTDFKDSDKGGLTRDSNSFYFQRFRLFTTVESADKKAKAYWSLEIGDIIWGSDGGASAGEYGCTGSARSVPGTVTIPPPAGSPPGTAPTVVPVAFGTPGAGTRANNGAGGCLGADGVNVETKNIWLWLDTGGWVPGTSVQLGIQNIVFMNSPWGGFFDDDGAAITLNWKSDMVDVQVWGAKFSEGGLATSGVGLCGVLNLPSNNHCAANADDVDAYAARIGVNVTKDVRLTLEGLVVDQRSLAGQSFGDDFWIGATAAVKLGDINLDFGAVYGQRAMARAASAGPGNPFQESGFGAYALVRAPVGPVNLNGALWYTTGDDTRGPCGQNANPTTVPSGNCSSSAALTKDSDKLPVPETGASWGASGLPYIGEWINGLPTIGNPAIGQNLYNDYSGTYGFGVSATYNLTATTSVGGGVAYVGATDVGAKWGDNVIEIDAGLTHRFNANVTMNLLGGYLIPDKGDSAWALAWRTNFGF